MIHKNKTIPSKIISIMLVLVITLGAFLGSMGTAVGESNLENGTHKVEVKALKESEDTIEEIMNPYIDGIGKLEVDSSISFAYITINDTSQFKSIKVRTEGAISPGPEDEVRTDVAIYTEPEIVEENPDSNTRTYKFEIEDVENAIDSVGYTHDDQKIWFRLKLAIIDENEEYTVTFDSDGGTDVAPVKAKWNETINEPETPEKNDRVFDGWYNGEQKIEFPMTVTENVILKVQWRQNRAVMYSGNGGAFEEGTINKSGKYENTDEDYLIPIKPPKRIGYNFLGWYIITNYNKIPSTYSELINPEEHDGYPIEDALDDNGKIKIPRFEDYIPSDNQEQRRVECFAKWELEGSEIPEYTLTLDTQGGTPIEDIKLKGNTPLKTRKINLNNLVTIKDGYDASWLYEGKLIKHSIHIIEDTTLTAQWHKLYTTTLNANGGIVYNVQTGKYEEITNIQEASRFDETYSSGSLTDPKRTGYTFEGWYDEVDNLVTGETIIPPRNITLKARWSKDIPADGQYTIDVNVWQEYKDEDSMAAKFFDEEKALLEVIEDKVYLTVAVHTEGYLGNNFFEDIITKLEQKMSDGTFKNLDLVPVEGEKKVKIKIEYPNMDDAVFIRCTIKPMGNEEKTLRVLLKNDTLEEIPDLIADGDYVVDVDILQEYKDEPSMSSQFFLKEGVPLKVQDGKMLLKLSVLKDCEFNGTMYNDPIEWLKQQMPNGDLELLAIKDMGDTKEVQLEYNNILKPAFVQVKVVPMEGMTPSLRVAVKKGSIRKLIMPDEGDYKANIDISSEQMMIFDRLFPERVGLPLKVENGKIYLSLNSIAYEAGFNPQMTALYIGDKKLDYTEILNEENEAIKACYELAAFSMEDTIRIELKLVIGEKVTPMGLADITFSLTPQYTVTFDSNGGAAVQPIIEYESANIPEPEILQQDGFIFLGWYIGDTKVTFPMQLTDNITLKAHWDKIEVMVKDVLMDGDLTTNGSVHVTLNSNDITYEYSIDGENWQEDNMFSNLDAGDYTVRVRAKDNPTNMSAKAFTIKKVEVLKPTVTDGKTTITEEDLNKDYVQIDLDGQTVSEVTVQIPSANKETTIKIASGSALPKIKAVKENQLTLEIPEGTSYETSNTLLQLPKIVDNTEAIKAAIEDLEGSNKDIKNIAAISVGGENTVIFGDYVMITLNGKAEKGCIFIDENGAAQPIKKVSKNAASTQTIDEYCYADGSDLVLMTKHFTEFATYDAVKIDNGGGSNQNYSWDKDGDYSVDIDVLKEHEDSSSMAKAFFVTRNLPLEIDDGEITLTIKVNKDGDMNGYEYEDVIKAFYYKKNGKSKKLKLKYLNDNNVRYVTTEIKFDSPDEEALIEVHIEPMLPSTPSLRIKLKKNTLGDEDDAIDLEPDEDEAAKIEGQKNIPISVKKNAKDIKFVNGYKDKTFRPNHNIKRAEVLAMLDKITELADDVDKKDVNFEDMDMWAKESIEKFAQAGIIDGYKDGSIKPNGEMTRAEFSKIIAIVMGLELKDEATELKDIKEHWAEKYINALIKKGYMKGYQDNTFKPNNKITRAEVVTVINRIIGSSTQDYIVKENPFTDIDPSHWAYKDVMKAVN